MEEEERISNDNHKIAIGSMFDNIAGRYDFLNHLLSFGIDRMWRSAAISWLSGRYISPLILDVAAGTGDLSIASLKLDPLHVSGIDISEKMIEKGKAKILRKGLNNRIDLKYGDSETIPFNDNTFDISMSAFGVRNFTDVFLGLSEMKRVLKNEGTIMVLEFSKPLRFPFRQLYFLYFTKLLPFIGSLFSKNRKAYQYLPDSVMKFPDNEKFMDMLESVGFNDVSQKRMTWGIVSVYTGIKRDTQ